MDYPIYGSFWSNGGTNSFIRIFSSASEAQTELTRLKNDSHWKNWKFEMKTL